MEVRSIAYYSVTPHCVWDHKVWVVGFRPDYVSCVPSWEFRDRSQTGCQVLLLSELVFLALTGKDLWFVHGQFLISGYLQKNYSVIKGNQMRYEINKGKNGVGVAMYYVNNKVWGKVTQWPGTQDTRKWDRRRTTW